MSCSVCSKLDLSADATCARPPSVATLTRTTVATIDLIVRTKPVRLAIACLLARLRRSGRDLQRHGGHVVVWRRVASERPHRREDRVDDVARGLVGDFFDDRQQAIGAELATESVH